MWFKWKFHDSLSQENFLWLVPKSLCLLKIKLGNCGLPQAPFEHDLLIGKNIIIICHVVDVIFYTRNEMDFVDMALQLHSEGVELELEDDAAGFLGVHIDHGPKTGFLNMMQKSLIK